MARLNQQAPEPCAGRTGTRNTHKGNMKKTAMLIALALTAAALNSMAQGQGGPPGGQGGPGGPGGPGGRGPGGFRGGGGVLMDALDLNKDGELDAREIQNAPIALRTLDKNKDFKLTRDELSGGRGPGGNIADRMMEMDANKDGKISMNEVPERMQGFVERMDTNGDGVVDKAEMDEMQKRMQERFAEGGGRGGGEEGRPPRDRGNE